MPVSAEEEDMMDLLRERQKYKLPISAGTAKCIMVFITTEIASKNHSTNIFAATIRVYILHQSYT